MDESPGAGCPEPFWVFAYGSLMWNPEFPYEKRSLARLSGYVRSLCLWSIRYRGTPESPGLVLGLDARPDADCTGIAYRIAPQNAEHTWACLREREMITYAYREDWLSVTLLNEERRPSASVPALCYIMDSSHPQYAGGISEEECAGIVARSRGDRGDNRDYLEETLRHLAEIGVREAELERMGKRVAALSGADN